MFPIPQVNLICSLFTASVLILAFFLSNLYINIIWWGKKSVREAEIISDFLI